MIPENCACMVGSSYFVASSRPPLSPSAEQMKPQCCWDLPQLLVESPMRQQLKVILIVSFSSVTGWEQAELWKFWQNLRGLPWSWSVMIRGRMGNGHSILSCHQPQARWPPTVLPTPQGLSYGLPTDKQQLIKIWLNLFLLCFSAYLVAWALEQEPKALCSSKQLESCNQKLEGGGGRERKKEMCSFQNLPSFLFLLYHFLCFTSHLGLPDGKVK